MKSYLLAILFVFLISNQILLSQCTNSVPSNAVAWWDADNASGSTVSDIRAGQNGLLQNGASVDSGYVCNAFNLNGIDDYITIAHSDSLTFSDSISDRPFSIEAWINLRDVTTSMIFSKGDDMEREYSFRLTGTIKDHLAVGLYDDRRSTGGNFNVIGLRSVFDFKQDENSWVHVACTYDGSGASSGIKLYRNGVQIPTTILVGTDSLGVYSAMRVTNKSATIGRFFSDGTQYLDGKVDELTVYSKELSGLEINTIYGAGSNGKCTTPIDNDTSGCHDPPWLSVKPESSNQELISKVIDAVNGSVDIKFNSNQTGQFYVYATDGKEVSEGNFENNDGLTLNLSKLNSGLYIIQIRTNRGQSGTLKWVKRN